MTNKQRITKLSRKESAAHDATGGGWGPGIVPQAETLSALVQYGIEGDVAEAIIADCVTPLGRFRMDENFREASLSPSEIRQQARQTAEVADELARRLRKIDPHLAALVNGYAYRMGDLEFPVNGIPFLTKLAVVMRNCAADAEAWPSKVPKRTGARNRLLTDVVAVVRQHVADLSADRAREIARRLLESWGVQAPSDDRSARRAMRAK